MFRGEWITDEGISAAPSGAFERSPSVLRSWVEPVSQGIIAQQSQYPAQANRYHLYVAWNCPWAHRTLLMRALKQLEDIVTVSVCAPRRTDQGWIFDRNAGYPDDLFDSEFLHELYSRSHRNYSGRVTVPILWDRETDTIVSNESADIVRMFGSVFNNCGGNDWDAYPVDLRAEIDLWNDRIHKNLNNGVYRAGFSESQEAYEKGFHDVFETLDALESHLADRQWLMGDELTEADARLFPTLARFDVAYFGAFKCNLRRLIDYPNLWDYARRLYNSPGVAATVRFDIYKQGYYSKSPKRNPNGIVPLGPDIDWSLPSTRGSS
ncbi:glutathione S-transferase family protein [Pseudahrensia aquimaris]|uniref:Glutathione S-transferase family protein n=1 Tax=Pseudahrensia aquimaris TaxID=744461 RepID=A0ABW3FCF9_9HYPH